MIFCKHDYEIIHQETSKGDLEIITAAGVSSWNGYLRRPVSLIVYKCKKCNKIREVKFEL